MRPTGEEVASARATLQAMVKAKIVPGKAARAADATIACAMALHSNEAFDCDKAAKAAFGVPRTTNVRKLWLPRLRRLDEARSEVLVISPAHPDGAIVGSAEPFRCRHKPSCASAAAHALTVKRKRQLFKEAWQRKQPPKRVAQAMDTIEVEALAPEHPAAPPLGDCCATKGATSPGVASLHTRPTHHDSFSRRTGYIGRKCQGTTQSGMPCCVDSNHSFRHAEPLRQGKAYCQHHLPGKFTGVRCAGITKKGRPCAVFSGSQYAHAAPLRKGARFCSNHARQAFDNVRCAGTTKAGAACKIFAWHSHAAAEPLRTGDLYCTQHSVRVRGASRDQACAACGSSGALAEDADSNADPAKRLWYCADCWCAYDGASYVLRDFVWKRTHHTDLTCMLQCQPVSEPISATSGTVLEGTAVTVVGLLRSS
jgi:hypothetical protein